MDPTARPSRPWLLALAVAACTIPAFLPGLRGEFLLWDDDANFLHNPYYRGLGPENLRWMFTHAFGHYMPLTWLTLGLDYVLWGMNPTGYHATNLALHALNAALFFLVLRVLFRRAMPDLNPDPAAVVAALLFSLHPLRVESVVWITERRDVLSCAFFLLTILAYLRSTESPARTRWLVLACLSFAAMLLSKTMGLTLPLLLIVLDVWPLRRFSKASLVEKVPLFALMIAGLVMISITAATAGGMSSREHYPLSQSLAQPGRTLSFYVLKTVLPIDLSPLYWYRPELGAAHVAGWAFVLAVTAGLVLARRRAPAALVAWLGYGILVAPVSGLVSLGSFYATDHYAYVPCLPFAALAGGLVLRAPRAVAAAASVVVLLVLSIASWRYCHVWQDSVSLWTRAVELDPDVYFSRAHRGRSFAARNQLDRALEDLNASLALEPRWHESWEFRGRVHLRRGDAIHAVEDATRALELSPKSVEALVIRGLGLARLNHPKAAIADFSSALQLRPQLVEAQVNRGLERAKTGDIDGALADLDAAVAFDPQPQLHVHRGKVRAMRGDLAGAAADFSRALETAPSDWPQRPQVEEFLRRARQ